MKNTQRFEMVLNSSDKNAISLAAELAGTSMANFVRSAAKEKARQMIDQETRLSLNEDDFTKFAKALNGGFKPNKALKRAMEKAGNLEIA
ncbi:hypothetical protein PSHI8_09600 [Polynucleobacter sp. SHI8]|uniref:type II toxin-antitoxin system TacA family antitoxin n=1 Tax=unclassified Polynucleobacter TaxID=2640945 RepID=UPI00248FA18D|nr:MULTISPECIES: DUF1778 domain-containing protein [unclassified Polynucleobacter]BDW10878.1 hypothetical protein PSHI2_09600 [Polynucleobacter sp. SHI2]BDW13324.1 hypothetical protein PSHI8_09600 [Polynucleobacter sp. SHI8]